MTPAEITAARESLSLNQRELAAALGIHPNIINRWERGFAGPPPYLWLALWAIEHGALVSSR